MDAVSIDKPTGWKDKAAFLVSALLSPFVIIPIFIMLVIARYSENMSDFWLYTGIAFLFSTVIPFGNVYIAVKRKKITDIHVAVREERVEPFIVCLLSILAGTYLLYRMGAPREIVVLGIVMGLNGAIFFLITLFWKISMHSSILAAVLVSLMILVDPDYAVGFVMFPILIWARMRRQRHNIYQGMAATILAAVGTYFVFRLFGFPK